MSTISREFFDVIGIFWDNQHLHFSDTFEWLLESYMGQARPFSIKNVMPRDNWDA